MRFFFLTIVAMIALQSFAQISSIKIESKPIQEEVTPYDSLEDINENNYRSLIGQTLFLRPSTKAQKDGYYWSLDLLTSPTTDYSAPKYMQRSSAHGPVVDYKANSKYFEILEMTEKTGGIEDYFFYKLREKESGDTVYFRFRQKMGFPSLNFVVVGYYEKMKSLMKGNKLVYKNWAAAMYPIYSLQDGKETRQAIPNNTIFECRDVTFLENEYYSMVYILHNDTYGDFFAKEYGFKTLFITYDKYLAEQRADQQRKKKLIAKYGQRNGQLVFDGKVRIGFSKAMCKEAWGEPDDINTTTGSWGVHEQWVYRDGSYLYFENGKLTSIQN